MSEGYWLELGWTVLWVKVRALGEGSWKESIFVIFLNEWNVYIVDGELCILVVAVGWARRLMIGNH